MEFKDKKISIFGDSISTYEGYNPDGYAVYYDKDHQRQNRLTKFSMTWWQRVITYFKGNLLQNNSYSGSRVMGGAFPAGTSRERIKGLRKDDKDPDIIMVYLGLNDYADGIPVKPRSVGPPDNKFYFAQGYDDMLSQLKDEYPQAMILAGSLMKARMKGYDGWGFPSNYHGNSFNDYNDAIRDACLKNDCLFMDLTSNGVRYESLDGTHPNNVGHGEMAGAWCRCIKNL